jgi:hypothetical protein
MKWHLHLLLVTLVTLTVGTSVNAQPGSVLPAGPGATPVGPTDPFAPPPADPKQVPAQDNQAIRPALPPAGPAAPQMLLPPQPADEDGPAALQKNVAELSRQLSAAQEGGQKDEKLQKQVELLQKQIDVQQKMINLLMKQMEKQPPTGAAVEQLQTQVTTLEARSKQTAQRDLELSQAVDNIVEHQDAVERRTWLPAPLQELFLPSGNNETPLSIYGALAFGYSRIIGNSTTAANGAGRPSTPGGFYFGEFTPDFFLKVNDWIFLEAEISVGPTGTVSAGAFAQADFFVNDWLTIIAGRFVAPIGWFNERLNNPWVNKLPADAPGSGPLLWQQVLPAMSLLGVEAQGSFYLGCSPLKFEYAAFVSNGLNLPAAPNINQLANLENMENTFNVITNDKAIGGRVGLWWPEKGLEAGLSGMFNGDYVAGGVEDSISLWAVDLNYHKGNWDFRFEYGKTYQQAGSFGANNIRRHGLYGQVAYRPRDLPPCFLQQMEFVYRYSYVDFRGIDPTALDLTTFATPMDVPVRRQQNEFGINYYFTPRLVFKVAYQINDEPGFHLHDNQFITELAWGW